MLITSNYAIARPHMCAHVCSAAALLVAQLQDCVEAVCNKCAQASGPKNISQTGGEGECTGKEEDGARGGESRAEWEKK